MRNNHKLIYSGLKNRLRSAYYGRSFWKVQKLNNWKFLFGLMYFSLGCVTIDPAGCPAKINESPHEVAFRITYHVEEDTTVITIDSCTFCGKQP